MSVINPNETAKSWRTLGREPPVLLYLSGAIGDAAALVGARVLDFPLSLSVIPVTDWIDPAELDGAAAAIVQVDSDSPAAIKRFERLAASTTTPLIAAAYEPPLALVRSLIRCGAHDVVPLPLDIAELETSLAPLQAEMASRHGPGRAATARTVAIIKSGGGAGATALLTQLATRFAQQQVGHGRDTCLIDFDVQFGDAAFQLGVRPKLTLYELIEAGARIDPDMVRSAAVQHSSGLKVVASPPEMMPLEALTSDQVVDVVDVAKRAFDTVFLDLPANWTNWSLSVLARADVALLVTELSVAGLNRARRQLDLIASQDLGSLDVRVVVNRFEKGLLRSIKTGDAEQALGRPIDYTVSNDPALMKMAIDRGLTIGEIKRKSALGRDIDTLRAGIAAALGLEA